MEPTGATGGNRSAHRGHWRSGFDWRALEVVEALRDSLWFEVAVYLLSALAMLLLPKQAIATYGEPSLEQATVES